MQLEKSLRLLRSLVERSHDSFEIIDLATARFVDANITAYQSLGYTREEFLKLKVFDIAPKIDRATYDDKCAQLNLSRSVTFEALHRRKDGTSFPVEITLSGIKLDRPYVLAVGRDITERRQAESALRQLALRLVMVHEEECLRLSREIHDQTGQEITALHLHLQTLRNDPAVSFPVRQHLACLDTLAQKVAYSIHQIARELRPVLLDELGLARALRRYALDWSKKTGILVDFQGDAPVGIKSINPMVEITLYRIAQEALHNVWKHARAKQVSLLLRSRSGRILLIVEDNGRGFPVEAAMSPGANCNRLGLTGMHERAALVDGTVSIESAIGKGTTLFVSIPLTDKTQNAYNAQSLENPDTFGGRSSGRARRAPASHQPTV